MKSFWKFREETESERKRRERNDAALDWENSDDAMDDRVVPREKKKKKVNEKSPPGFEGTVKAMKKHKDIDNPWALAWYMKNKGYKSHKTKDGKDKK